MKCLALAVVLLLTSTSTLRADFRHGRMGPRPRAMGSAFVGVADDANAVSWNPAGLPQMRKFEITGCRTSLYSVDALSGDLVSMAYNWQRIAAVGLSWYRLGLEDIYSETTINLALARDVPGLKGLSIGVGFKLLVLDAPGYERYNDPAYNGSVVEPSLDIGVHYHGSEKWSAGFVAYNVNEPGLKLLETTERADPVYRDFAVGAKYIFSGLLLTTIDLRTRYGSLSNTVLRVGSEMWFFDAVALRGGFLESHMTAGIALKGVRWQLDAGLETHNDLGNTYQFAATIRL